VVVLELEGDLDKKLRRRLREEIVQEWRELFRASDLAAEAVRAAELVFARKGRLTPELSVSEEAGSEQHLVRMKVSPGPRARVGGFEFPGATSIGEDELRAAALSAAEPALLRPLLTPSLLEGAATAVEALYRSRGWLDARVGAATWEVVDGGERATVSLPVSEGARLLLGDVRFRGNRLWPASELSERLALATGGHLEPQELDRATRALIGYYDAEGHAEVAVIWSLARQDDAATVTFEIEEGRQYRVGTVSVLGAQRTRESLIRKVARIETGQPFSRDALTEASRRLLASGLFQRASARGAPESSLEGTRAVFVQVLERDPVSLSAGLGFDDQEGLSGSFTAVHSNLRGRGTSLASRLRLGGSESEGELALRLPRLGARKTDFLATLGLRRESRPSLTVERLGLALEATRPRSWPGRVQSSFRAEEVRLDDIETSDFDQSLDEGFFAELGVSLVRDTRDSTLTPKRGSLSTLRLSLGAGLNATTSLFPRLFARHARFHELRPGLIHSMGLRLGVGSALEGPRLPLAERYRAGGITTLRGFARDRVGPLDPLTGEALGGDALLILNQELSLQVSSRVSVHAFVDVGHVYDEVGELWDLDLRLSAGLGVGTNTPIGPFRLYHAWVLDRRDDERRSRFHFAFTSTF
jgi:outer membrane protein assembly complex protein YaeT